MADEKRETSRLVQPSDRQDDRYNALNLALDLLGRDQWDADDLVKIAEYIRRGNRGE